MRALSFWRCERDITVPAWFRADRRNLIEVKIFERTAQSITCTTLRVFPKLLV
ncbi:hypothetical protein CBM2605_A180014 [Cupriavidus neocaledonicus]|uniref:Transposase n=1 Tax=Cupriavidus neocaledonicus TaxID=1040979 RepID=A0ABY1UYB5_9BURK|nr:hypothetical protein CBM2605_A180014 [Cupriavidus neocaledonicus]